jgi:hypothetical protein
MFWKVPEGAGVFWKGREVLELSGWLRKDLECSRMLWMVQGVSRIF